MQSTVEELRISPEILPLLRADLGLPRIVLDKPEIDLDLTGVVADVKTEGGVKVQVDEASLLWHNLNWSPVTGSIDFSQGKTQVKVNEAKWCNIDSPGELTIADSNLSFNFTLDGKELDVAYSLLCLSQGKSKMTGILDVTSRISAQGQADELIRKMQGPLNLTLTNGVVEQDRMLTTILEVLNATEIVMEEGALDFKLLASPFQAAC